MQYNKVEICGVNTSSLTVLSEERKKELLNIIRNGSESERKRARDEMIQGNLRLVLSVIQRFAGRGENADDLFQVGVIGLIKAIDHFDCTMDVKFSTYGVPMAYSGRNPMNKPFRGGLMSSISYRKAIELSIGSIIDNNELSEKTKEDVIKILKNISKRDYFTYWDKEKIISALKDYKARTGLTPTVTSLTEIGMPKATTIQTHFHIKASLLLKRLFPADAPSRPDRMQTNPYGLESAGEWIACFREQFEKHGCPSSKRYNALRDSGTPTWNTIAKYLGLGGWRELMETAGVRYRCTASAEKLRVTAGESPTLKKLETILTEKQKLSDELRDVLGR